MSTLRIAAAQSVSTAGDIDANVLAHMKFIAKAHREGVDLLVFPELSLSGYELSLVKKCRVHPEDIQLSPIRSMARETQMTVVVGAPVAGIIDSTPSIAAIIFFPDGKYSIYRKRFLHVGEEKYVSGSSALSRSYPVGDESFAMAICADTKHEQHALDAAATGASLYVASVLVTDAGYTSNSADLQRHSVRHRFGVLMSNHGGPSGGYASAGRSTFWEAGGRQVIQAPGTGSVLVVVSRSSGLWSGELIEVEV